MVAVGIPGATPFGGHAGAVRCVAFSPEGTACVTGGADGVLRLWDVATKAQTRQLIGHAGPVLAVAWSPNGASLVTGGEDHMVRLWDVPAGQQTWQLARHNHPVRTVAWSPDGTTIASGANSVRLWDAATGQQTRKFTEHDHPVNAVAWHPGESVIASASRSVRIWDADTGLQFAHLTGDGHAVQSVAWNPKSNLLATSGGRVRIWDVRSVWDTDRDERQDVVSGSQVRQITGGRGEVQGVAWSPDDTTIATVSGSLVELWDAATGQQQTIELFGHTAEIRDIAWSRDGTIIATASDDGTARLWDTATGTQTAQLTGHTAAVNDVAWSSDGTTLATVGDDGSARLWDAVTGSQTSELITQTGPARAISWSPDGTTIATASDDGTARLWDTATGTVTTRLGPHTGVGQAVAVFTVAWSADGTSIATGGEGGITLLWDAATGTQIAQLTGHTNWVSAAAWSPDGTMVATASGDGTARLWDAATGTQLSQLDRHAAPVYDVAWSPDGTTIASASGDGIIRLWDTATGVQTGQLTGHASGAFVAWSPDGVMIASASADGTARLWDTSTGTQTIQLTGHTGPVNEIAWSPDGTTIATVGGDGTIRIWNPRNGAQINGTGFGVARATTRALAGVRSDSPSVVDLLGVGDDVGTLAELIAATETKPPLAIALIGNWGAGKSSVMLQVEARVAELATKARNNPGLSAFAENVRQVRFNAWHYSDDHLWAGLVSHLFEGLARPENPEAGQGEPGDRSARAEIARVRGELAAKEKRLPAKRAAADALAAKLKNVDKTAGPQGAVKSLGSPLYAGKVLVDAARQAFRDVRTGLLAVVIWAVLGGAAYLAWRFLGAAAGSVSATIAVLAGPAVAVLRKLRAAHDSVLAFVDQRHADLVASRNRAQQDVRDAEQEIRDLRDRLVLVDAAEGLARFLDDRAEGTAYREYRGLLGQVRADLDQLSASLEKARRQWARGGRLGPPPLERIVLYIDDLDRCPPRRVVEVLEAVHLMLALDLFVVVVAVDARWLIRSLEYHHRELFKIGDGHQEPRARPLTSEGHPAGEDMLLRGDAGRRVEEGGQDEGEAGLATPIDYLDKIFQIPFVLLPPQPAATALYLRSLLPEPTRAPTGGPAGQGTGEAKDQAGAGIAPGAPDGPSAGRAPAEDAGQGPADGAAAASWQAPGATRRAVDAQERNGQDESRPSRRDERDLLDGRRRGTGASSRAGASNGLAAQPVAVELRPQGLQLTQPEVEFMGRLGGLLPTPRAAKRLVNIYRLVRIGVPAPELAGFVGDEAGGPYQAVQVLLAMLVGHPLFAREVFRAVLSGHPGQDLAEVVAEVAGRGGGTRPFGIIYSLLVKTRGEAPLAVSMELSRQWCPQLARFSFYTRDLARGYLDMAASAGLADVDLGRDALAELGDVADDTDKAAAGPEAV